MLRRIRDFFGLRYRKKSNYPTPLPSHINDNQYLAASARAGVVDRETGAYDKYLFEDREIPEMPYEAAVDDHLELMSSRLAQRFRRHVSWSERRAIRAQSQLDSQSLRQKYLDEAKASKKSELDKQERILRGEANGRLGLSWIGESPAVLSPLMARVRLASRYVLFLFVGLIDGAIIQLSFFNLGIQNREAWLLMLPALGVLIAFPHLAGLRLAYLTRGLGKRISVWFELFALLGVWLGFVVVMTFIRVQFIRGQIELDGPTVDQLNLNMLTFLNIAILLGLGGWLIFLAVRENPHEIEALRAKVSTLRVDKQILRSAQRANKAAERLRQAQEALKALSDELATAVNASRTELSEAAKSVYRRALINEMADPEFTRSYFPEVAGNEQTKKT